MNLLFQGRGYVATFESVPFVGGPRECRGYVGAEVGIVNIKIAHRVCRANIAPLLPVSCFGNTAAPMPAATLLH